MQIINLVVKFVMALELLYFNQLHLGGFPTWLQIYTDHCSQTCAVALYLHFLFLFHFYVYFQTDKSIAENKCVNTYESVAFMHVLLPHLCTTYKNISQMSAYTNMFIYELLS